MTYRFKIYFVSLFYLVLLIGTFGKHHKSTKHFDLRNHTLPSNTSSTVLCMYFGLCTVPPTFPQPSNQLHLVYQWKQLEFDYDTPEDRQRDIDNGAFIVGAPVPIDVDVYYGPNDNNRIFLTIPRFQPGVPATVAYVTDKNIDGNPVIAPYPNWSWHRNPQNCNPDRIVSVYRVQVDECGRIWILDNGRFIAENVCPAQILAFDLRTNTLVHRFEIPVDQMEPRSILVTPMVDIRNGQCTGDTYVYVADAQAFSIIVHDTTKGTSWRIIDKSFYPYPNYGTFTILGDSFELMDGVLGMALAPVEPSGDRKLFYHSLSSATENWVWTSYLQNATRFADNPSSSPEIFHTYDGRRASQSAAQAIDRNGIQYFGLAEQTSINCWNTESPDYGGKYIDTIEYNPVTLQFASGVKVITNPRGQEELWVMTMKFQKVANGDLNLDEFNFRIQTGYVTELTRRTHCGIRQRPGHPFGFKTHHHSSSYGH